MVVSSIEEVNKYLLRVFKNGYRNEDHRLIQLRPNSLAESDNLTNYTAHIIAEIINMLIHDRLYDASDELVDYIMSIVIITPSNGLITFRRIRTINNTLANDKISIRRFIKLKSDNVIQTVVTHYSS